MSALTFFKRKNTIGTKIAVCLISMGIATMGVCLFAAESAKRIDQQVDSVETASRHVVFGDKIGNLVTVALVEARGIVGSAEPEDMRQSIGRLRLKLDEISATMRQWGEIIAPQRAAEFARLDAGLDSFIALRRDIIALANRGDVDAARTVNDSEAGRNTRAALLTGLAQFSQRSAHDMAGGFEAVSNLTDTLQADLVRGTALAVALAVLLTCLLGQILIARPIRKLTSDMVRLAGGDMTIDTGPLARHSGEVGAMARALGILARAVKHNVELVEEIRTRDDREALLTRDAAVKQRAAALDAKMSGLLGRLTETSRALNNASGTLTEATGRANEATDIITAASNATAERVDALASAADELSLSISEVGARALDSAGLVRDAVSDAEATTISVSELSDTVQRIGDVVDIIRMIAEQTNLLALNATIEAARAGEAGRGFAVVAQEVKALASQTSRATGDISAHIQSVQDATRRSIGVISTMRGRIDEIDRIAASIAAAVEEQSASTRMIAANVRAAADGAATASNTVATVGDAADRTDESAEQVSHLARALDDDARVMQQEMGAFFASLRTG